MHFCESCACLGSLDLHPKLLEVNGSWSPPPFPPSSLTLPGPLKQTREKVVLFLEGTATCRSEGGKEPESVVISAITCAHVTGLGSRALQSKPQKARNYRCLSFSITESLNTSGGTTRPPPAPLQLGGKLSLSNNPQLGYFLLVQGHLK